MARRWVKFWLLIVLIIGLVILVAVWGGDIANFAIKSLPETQWAK